MPNSIFSAYSQGENQVTSTFLAVLKRLSLHNLDALLSSLLDDSLETVKFINQPSAGKTGVPDAEITANIQILVETKVVKNTVNKAQLVRHASDLNDSTNAYLLVLTPDQEQPKVISEIQDEMNRKEQKQSIHWISFLTLSNTIRTMVKNNDLDISEHERFVLTQLNLFLKEKSLLSPDDDTVIVAARFAWPEYLNTGIYTCQVNRPFRNIEYMGFYNSGRIQPKIAKVNKVYDDIELTTGAHGGELGSIIEKYLTKCPDMEGVRQKVFLLSSSESGDTVTLDNPIFNVKKSKSKSNKTTAYTMGQRYVMLKHLRNATDTDDILKNSNSGQ